MEQPNYARHALAEGIQRLEHDLLEMGARADTMVGDAVEALARLDVSSVMRVVAADDEIDELDVAIEQRCIRFLALQQPMAGDLREIGTVMKVITDIERIADLAVDIAKIAMKVDKEYGHTDFIDLRNMAGAARKMFEHSLQAFVKRDLALVESICKQDDEVDQLYRDLRGQIHDHMRRQPENVVSASWMLLAIHHVERIADHAVNIAERVSFMVTGRLDQIASSHRSELPRA